MQSLAPQVSGRLRTILGKFHTLRAAGGSPPGGVLASKCGEPAAAQAESRGSRSDLPASLAHRLLGYQLSLLLLQTGFEAFQTLAISCLKDLAVQFILDVCRSVQFYGEGCAADGRTICARLIRDFVGRGPGRLVRLLKGEPEWVEARLDRAIDLVARSNSVRAAWTGSEDAEADADADADATAEALPPDLAAEDGVDLDLLGSTSDYLERDAGGPDLVRIKALEGDILPGDASDDVSSGVEEQSLQELLGMAPRSVNGHSRKRAAVPLRPAGSPEAGEEGAKRLRHEPSPQRARDP